MKKERWLPVVGWEELYEVSNLGRVRSLDKIVQRTGRHGTASNYFQRGRIRMPSLSGPLPRQYWSVMLHDDGFKKRYKIHTLVLNAFVGPCPEGMVARHFPDNDPANNHVDNLSWGTKKQNCADKLIHGTNNHGERCGVSKITEKDVRTIFMLGDIGMSFKDISKVVGICDAQARRIFKGKSWPHMYKRHRQTNIYGYEQA